MIRVMLLLAALCLTGCASMVGSAVRSLPSVKGCHKVEYTRLGNLVKINAECMIPIEDTSALPVGIMP